jgi:hypothetical protein
MVTKDRESRGPLQHPFGWKVSPVTSFFPEYFAITPVTHLDCDNIQFRNTLCNQLSDRLFERNLSVEPIIYAFEASYC